jgi:hypothetical protein
VTVQRNIEMIGIPTVLITVEPEESAQARPPRALCPEGFIAGHSLGRANDVALQQWIIMEALSLLLAPPAPGDVIRRSFVAREE